MTLLKSSLTSTLHFSMGMRPMNKNWSPIPISVPYSLSPNCPLVFADLIDGSGVLNCFRHLERMGSGRSSSGAGSIGRGGGRGSLGDRGGGGTGTGGAGGTAEDMSSSSFSSTDTPSSPTASYNGENLLHFHGDSSGSL